VGAGELSRHSSPIAGNVLNRKGCGSPLAESKVPSVLFSGDNLRLYAKLIDKSINN
jgi:hypothetical protein